MYKRSQLHPATYRKRVKFGVKNEAKRFYQTKDHYFLFLDRETQNVLKNKNFLPYTILNLCLIEPKYEQQVSRP